MAELSKVFNYVSSFRHSGHQIGRKIGDMLELLTFSAIARDKELYGRLRLEPKLYGFSEAGHKVEFAFNRDPQHTITGGEILEPKEIIGFIECKKVGVEQTINSGFKKSFVKHDNRSMKIPFGEVFVVGFSPRGGQSVKYNVNINKTSVCVFLDNKKVVEETLLRKSEHKRIIFALHQNGQSTVIPNSSSLRGTTEYLQNCRILEIFGYDDGGVFAVLNDCLPGPQTPEKAKQSSFVALDIRKKRFGSFDKRPAEIDCVSILVLTEFSHWEQKSRNMISACIDANLVVEDEIIIKAFNAFEESFGSDYYDLITKEAYLSRPEVRQTIDAVVEQYLGKIFRDMSGGDSKQIRYSEGKLIVL